MGVGPPLYNQRGRRPGIQPQWTNQGAVAVDYPPRKIQNLNPYANYDYYDDIGPAFNAPAEIGRPPKNLEPPPKEVEEAVETLSNYLNNASQSEMTNMRGQPMGQPMGQPIGRPMGQSHRKITTTLLTTMTTTKRTTTSTTQSTSKRTSSTEPLKTTQTNKISAAVLPKKKKPTSSFDNDKDSNDGTNNSNDTIKACKYKKYI